MYQINLIMSFWILLIIACSYNNVQSFFLSTSTPSMTKKLPNSSILVTKRLLVSVSSKENKEDEIQTLDIGKGKTVVIAGATGYIGKAVVREAVRQGYNTVALVRDEKKVLENKAFAPFFKGAKAISCNVCNPEELTQTLRQLKANVGNIDAIVSCLASRSGTKKDSYAIDYGATLNCLESGKDIGARHFVLLSAFCVKNPWLQFQKAKLLFEDALTTQKDLTYSIVRPTAFMKSVSGQLEVVSS
jgi:divinyl chlorophyllide a 8-vinyl-reductase